MSIERDACDRSVVQQANEQLRTGIDKCRSLVSECKLALAEGTAEPAIFAWSDEPVRDAEDHKALDPKGYSSD